ncbi:MAG: aconitase X swivel domain-containing protein [Archaeoglobaceae archaeon]
MKRIKGRVISKGEAEGEIILSRKNFSFLGDVDVNTGIVVADDSDIQGESISGKIFVFPYGRGSTVGSYSLLSMKKNGVAPKAIINLECDAVIAVGAIISSIPLVDKLEEDPLKIFRSGNGVRVSDGDILF